MGRVWEVDMDMDIHTTNLGKKEVGRPNLAQWPTFHDRRFL